MAAGQNTKMNISYTIRAIDRFSKVHQKLERQLNNIERRIKTLTSSKKDIKLDVDESPLKRKLEKIASQPLKLNVSVDNLEKIEDSTVKIEADTRDAERDISRVDRKVKKLPIFKRITIFIQSNFNEFRRQMDRIADFSRDFGEVMQNMLVGTIVAHIPAIATGLQVLAGGLGAVASAATTAGLGVAGFAAVAVPSITGLIDKYDELKKAQEKVAQADTAKKRAKALKELSQVQSQFSQEQLKSVEALNKFNQFYTQFSKQFEKPVLQLFNSSLVITQQLLTLLQPAIQSVADTANRLMDAFNRKLQTEEMQSFFAWVGETAGPTLEKLVTAAGNFALGLANIMMAFDPLAKSFTDGLLGMSESFLNWTRTLGENQQFQEFLRSVQENTPVVLEYIGSFVRALWDLITALAPVGVKVAEVVTSFMNWLSAMLENHKWLGTLLAYMTVAIGVFTAFIAPVLLVGRFLISMLSPAFKVVSSAVNNLSKVMNKQMLKAIASVASKFSWFARTPVGLIISAIILLATIIISHWDKIRSWTEKTFNKIASFINNAISRVGQSLAKIGGFISSAIAAFTGFLSGVRNVMNLVYSTIKKWIDNARRYLAGVNLSSIGRNMILGLINGIKSMAGKVVGAIKNVVKGAIESAKRFLGIHSPSRVFRDIGLFTGEGFALGMDKSVRMIEHSATRMANAAVVSAVAPSVYVPKVTRPDYYEQSHVTTQPQSMTTEVSSSKQPALIVLQLGRESYQAFVDDITQTQKFNSARLTRFKR